MPVPSDSKPKTIAIDARLHGYLLLLRARDARSIKQVKELVEPALWELVRENREWLEEQLGEAVSLPDPAQLELPVIVA